MQKINIVNQLSISDAVVKIILSKYQISNFTYELINDGLENISLLVNSSNKKYVLRVYRRLKKTDAVISLELKFQEYLKVHGLSVPSVYPNKEGEPLTVLIIENLAWQVILMEYMGKTNFTTYSPALIAEMAKTQAKMHLLGIQYAKTQKTHESEMVDLKDRIRKEVNKENIKNKERYEFLERTENFYLSFSKQLPYGYNHLDFDAEGNVLIKDNKISAILDFDDLSYSPCIVCLGYTLWHVLFITNDENFLRRYIAEYIKVRPLAKEEYEILPQILLFRNYILGMLELIVRRRGKYIDQIINLEKEILKMRFDN